MKKEMITNCIGLEAEPLNSREDLTINQTNKETRDDPNHFQEYEDICEFLVEVWGKYDRQEVQGFITMDGKLIITAIGNSHFVEGPKPLLFNDTYYLPWNKQDKPNTMHKGTIERAGSSYIFIPVKAMFHTHVLSGPLSQEDQLIAGEMKDMIHLVIERRKISEFDDQGIRKSYKGNFTNLCELLYN